MGKTSGHYEGTTTRKQVTIKAEQTTYHRENK